MNSFEKKSKKRFVFVFINWCWSSSFKGSIYDVLRLILTWLGDDFFFFFFWLGDDLTLKRKPNHATRVSYGFSLRANAALNSSHSSYVEVPRQWYNLVADLSVKPPPQLHPKTFEPIKPEDLAHLFPNEIIKQEETLERFIDIPEEVLEIYKLWRPTPLIRFLFVFFFFFFLCLWYALTCSGWIN